MVGEVGGLEDAVQGWGGMWRMGAEVMIKSGLVGVVC